MFLLYDCGGSQGSPKKTLASRERIHHVDLLSTINNIDVPGWGSHFTVSKDPRSSKPCQASSSQRREGDRVKDDIRISAIHHSEGSFPMECEKWEWRHWDRVVWRCVWVGEVRHCASSEELGTCTSHCTDIFPIGKITIHYWILYQTKRHDTGHYLQRSWRYEDTSYYFVGLRVFSALHGAQEANSIKPTIDKVYNNKPTESGKLFCMMWEQSLLVCSPCISMRMISAGANLIKHLQNKQIIHIV